MSIVRTGNIEFCRGWFTRGTRVATLLALAFAGTQPQPGRAQTEDFSRPPANRWLLVLETSHAMQPRAGAARELASMLVYSGMNGQAHPGDTIGLWTFNQQLYAGQFPLQEWNPAENKLIAAHMYEYLDRQKSEKESDFNAVLPQIQRLIKDSKFISIFLITDGEQSIHGTPFDDKINATYRAWRVEQAKAKMPFVTMLRAKDGRFTDYVVNVPPWPMQLPPLPAELEPHKIAAPKPEKIPPRVLPPLILSGRKTESESKTAPAESPETNTAAPITTPSAAEPTSQPAAASADAVTSVVPPGPPSRTGAGEQTSSISHSGQGTSLAREAEPTERSASLTEKANTQGSEVSPPVEATNPRNETPEPMRQPAPATSVALAETAHPSATLPAAASRSALKPTPQGRTPRTPYDRSAEIQTAAGLLPETFWDRKSTWIFAGFIAAGAVAAVFLLARRSRSGSGTSLITRSFEQQQKGE